MNIKAYDKKFFAGGAEPVDIEIVRADGSYFYDADGKEYLDFLTGWCVGNLGWNNKTIIRSIENFTGPDYVYPGFYYKPWVELAELLASIAPKGLSKCFRTSGGTESVETALLVAMCYTGRKKFMSLENAYHGNSIGTLSIGASENRDTFKNLLPGCYKVDTPLDTKALRKIENRLKNKDVAAFIMEPVPLNLGVVVPDKEFMSELRRLCTRYGTLLILDEVATGFGRTGKLFATEHFDISPDILCISKALSGGYLGIGATLTTEKIARRIGDKVSIYSTYGWHPLSTQASIANLGYMLGHKAELMENVKQLGELFYSRLTQLKFRKPANVRVCGAAIGIDLASAPYAQSVYKKCLDGGLFLQCSDKQITMFPAINTDPATAIKGLDIFENCIG